MSKVAVIFPTCNRSYYLRNAIAIVLAQTFTDLEIIVVDDVSFDDTENVVKEFSEVPGKYIRHSPNRGGSVARNTGITHSQSEYIAFRGDGDEWMSTKLAVQVAILESCLCQVGAVYSAHDIIDRCTREKIYVEAFKKGKLMKTSCN